MRISKKCISLLLVSALCFSLVHICAISALADSFFDSGDFTLAIKSDDTLAIAKYKGEDQNVKLPTHVEGRKVTGVYSHCFENTNIKTIEIPDLYSTIGAFAFNGCEDLKSVDLPLSLQSIGIMAFSGSTSLKSVTSSRVTELKVLPYAAFSGCTSLETVEIPESVNTLGDNVFTNCSSLTEVKLPAGITKIPEYTFYGCSALEYLDIPDSVTELGESAFENTSIKEIFIPEAVESIGENCFTPAANNGNTLFVCYKGTFAESYFENNSVANCRAIDKTQGDFNLDGKLNISDATAIQKYKAQLGTNPLRQALETADVTGDGEVSVRDATLIQMRLAEIISSFD